MMLSRLCCWCPAPEDNSLLNKIETKYKKQKKISCMVTNIIDLWK